MAEAADDRIAEGKLDLVPMIDCIMLLLLFFILTTKFTSEEKTISSLLPTDKGQAATKQKTVEPPQQVSICIYPAGLQKGGQPSQYFAQLHEMQPAAINVIPKAWIRIGSADPIELDGSMLHTKNSEQMQTSVNMVHQYIKENLAKFEVGNAADRKAQAPITIQCFSGMSWMFALVAYDACRGYEGGITGRKSTGKPTDFDDAREVDFAPPRIRDYSAKELGEELFEIVNAK